MDLLDEYKRVFRAVSAVSRLALPIDLLGGVVMQPQGFKTVNYAWIAQQISLVSRERSEYTVGFRTIFMYSDDVCKLLRSTVLGRIDKSMAKASQPWRVRSVRVLHHRIDMRDNKYEGFKHENVERMYINLVAFKLERENSVSSQ